MGGGGGGGPGQKASLSGLVCLFFSPQLILQFTEGGGGGSNGFMTEKTILFQGSRGGPTFSRGSNFFQGGPNANFYRNPYNL